MMDGFVIPASTPGSPDSVARRRKMAELMLVQSGQPERITHWSQGANKLAQALLGGINMRRADTQEAEGRNSANDMLVRALSGDMGVAPSQQDPQGTMIQAMNDPWQSPQGQQMLYQQWQRENTPPDPMDALQQQKLQLEIQQMQNPRQAKPTDDMREYEFAKSQGYQGTFQDYQIAMKKAGASSVSVNGDMKLTEGQSKDLNFYSRGKYANRNLTDLENSLLSLPDAVGGRVPIGGNYLKSPQYRQAERAGREFLAIALRKDTGAAVTDQEFALYAPMYLPQPGDDAQTIADKRAAREQFLASIRMGGGTARSLFDQVDQEFATQFPEAPKGADDGTIEIDGFKIKKVQ